jgi:hypothetical protein
MGLVHIAAVLLCCAPLYVINTNSSCCMRLLL